MPGPPEAGSWRRRGAARSPTCELAASFHDDAGAAPQEQAQIITSAIGRPAPKAPTIINVNAESKFASAWISRPDIPLLRRAPTGIARRPRMNDQECRRREKVVTTFEYRHLPETRAI